MGNILGIPHSWLGRQATGVIGTKTLIRLLYPRLVKLCDICSMIHDEAYDQDDPTADNFIDWLSGSDATLKADNAWRDCALARVTGQYDEAELTCQILNIAYPTIRRWGRMRAWLWRHGVRY
jgi:hypothetical protein